MLYYCQHFQSLIFRKTKMKKINVALIVLFFCLSGLSWAARQPNVVVFPLKAEGISPQTANLLTERIQALLSRSGRVRVLERNEIDRILETAGFNYDEITSEMDGIEMGKLLNAHKIISGSITRIGDRITIAAYYLDVETSVREISANRDINNTSEDRLIDFIPELVDQIVDRIPLEGSILEADGDTIIVDIGTETGIKIGTMLTVEQVKDIRDPYTGEVRSIPQKVGSLEVIDFAGKEFARCVIVSVTPKLRSGMRVHTEMESIAVLKHRARQKRAIISSSFVPGRGQLLYKQNRGWLYLAGTGGALGMSVFSWMKFNEAKDNYDDSYARYMVNKDNESIYAELLNAADDKSRWKDQIPVFAALAGGIWVVSIVDAYIWGGGKTADFADAGTSKPQLLLVAGPRQLGISVRF